MELLLEDWGGELELHQVLTESNESKNKFSGIIMSAERRNKNGRIYPRTVMKEALTEYLTRMQGKPMLGELSHPNRSTIDIRESCIVFDELYYDDKTDEVKGTVIVLEGDGARGDKLMNLIRKGWRIGVSSRAVGEVSNGIVKKMRIITPGDIVCSPSGVGCWLQ